MTVERLHISYGGYLLTCLRLYGVPEQECEDVRQDIYLRLLESKRKISDDNIKGFCSKIARDAAVDFKRKSDRTPTMESMSIVDEHGMTSMHPELDAQALARWETMIANPNKERIEQALELAQMYECQPGGPTAYEVIDDLLFGLSMEQIGEKHNVAKATISRWMSDWYVWIKEQLS
ncbi:MAG: hypothetical protein WC052_04850 [Patescibacteria group bacterium]|jgi:DNA-directed RNA polymerase specialized sigma24 family protein